LLLSREALNRWHFNARSLAQYLVSMKDVARNLQQYIMFANMKRQSLQNQARPRHELRRA
jgi:hypothetical protein